MPRVAIIGGGVAGVSTATILNAIDANVTLFDMQDSLISGPPFCHLHAGGNLYPDITDKERVQLLKESIEFLRYYPFSVDFRPTVIAFPKRYPKSVQDFLPTLNMLKSEYQKLASKDSKNQVLGEPDNYYKLYYKEDLEKLATQNCASNPKNCNEWLIPVAKYVNLEKLQFPIIVVQEYGLNLFRLSAGAKLILDNLQNINLQLNTKVTDITKNGDKFTISYTQNGKIKKEEFDFLVNAAGFNSGTIDDMLGFKKERLVEFKAAFVTKWQSDIKFPEIIFHGERGSSEGMAQFTPYANNFYQLHGMTENATLYEDGLAKSTSLSAQPKLPKHFCEKIYKGWSKSELESRTKNAISHMGYFIPTFKKEATVAAKPLYGAQQIPGCNISLRGTEVEFINNYARCEIVKVSSALTMAKEIAKKLKELGLTNKDYTENTNYLKTLNQDNLNELAQFIAKSRNYPKEMGLLVNACCD